MTGWVSDLGDAAERNEPVVLVTVARAKGSTPREAGAKMIVGGRGPLGTIGGGHLEYRALELARELLGDNDRPETLLHDFALGPSLGQCCGGNATILFERLSLRQVEAWLTPVAAELNDRRSPVIVTRADTGRKLVLTSRGETGSLGDDLLDRRALGLVADTDSDNHTSRLIDLEIGDNGGTIPVFIDIVRRAGTEVMLFGAGHVGKGIVHALGPLPDFRITWIDGRAEQFPHDVPANVDVRLSETPVDEVESLPPGAIVLVMTHSHALDYEIVEKVLRRGDFRFCGLIGSKTKRAQFIKRLAHRGMPPETVQRLTCPIGIAGIDGKHPAEIAIAVAAEILQLCGQASEADAVKEASA
ncbi:MAG: xanthine dehydrogenase accessory protein XdhC [Alphaproteobacteria bacterium]|nr:xanthine dehydrogenase accessory protein XdhC [Alphaproteobacteria bacterium]